jgi:TolB-like protein
MFIRLLATGIPSAAASPTFTAGSPRAGKSTKESEIGKELGVKYVLEGSVHKATDRVRIGVELADASTDRNVDVATAWLNRARWHPARSRRIYVG